MAYAQMTEIERNRAILSMLALNEQVRELGHTIAKVRESGADKEIAADLASVANSLDYDLRDRILDLVRQNLGPQQQANLLFVLRKASQRFNSQRFEFQPPPQNPSGLLSPTPD